LVQIVDISKSGSFKEYDGEKYWRIVQKAIEDAYL